MEKRVSLERDKVSICRLYVDLHVARSRSTCKCISHQVGVECVCVATANLSQCQ